MECAKLAKNLKSSRTSNSSLPLPPLVAPNDELQLDFARPLQDEKGRNVFILVAVDRFSKFPSALLTKNTGSKKLVLNLCLSACSSVLRYRPNLSCYVS